VNYLLIADSLDKKAVDLLKAEGYDVRMDPKITEESLAQEIVDANVLIVRSKKVNAAAIDAAKSLGCIIRAGAGYNTIDYVHAAEKGIFVCNTPGMNNDAVAELAFGHILACDRCITTNTQHLRNAEWRKALFLKCEGLRHRKLGIIGRGNIAKSVCRIAKGFEMDIIMYSPHLTPAEAKEMGVEYAASINDVAAVSDAVTVHIAYNKNENFHLFGADFFSHMKNGAIFVNTSRGEVVDTEAMLNAIKEKNLKVGVDVYEGEPAKSNCELPEKLTELAKQVTSCTCHIGASTNEAGDRIADETVRVATTFIKTGEALNCVNLAKKVEATGVLTVRHTGVLDKIVACVAKNNAQCLTVSNKILAGSKAQIATIVFKMENPACFKSEVIAIEGVIGASCNKAE